jgi:hypothetical protein
VLGPFRSWKFAELAVKLATPYPPTRRLQSAALPVMEGLAAAAMEPDWSMGVNAGGVTSLSCPVFDSSSRAIAALTTTLL